MAGSDATHRLHPQAQTFLPVQRSHALTAVSDSIIRRIPGFRLESAVAHRAPDQTGRTLSRRYEDGNRRTRIRLNEIDGKIVKDRRLIRSGVPAADHG